MSVAVRWLMQEEPIDDHTSRFRPLRDGAAPGRADFFEALADDPACRAALTLTLAQHRFDAFFWETPPIDESLKHLTSEFVLVQSPTLAGVHANPAPFTGPLSKAPPGAVARFPNLSGDAWLVVPRALAPARAYPHLARFLREAPPEQVDALWSQVGVAVRAFRAARRERLWVSTSGLGVFWLHVRLDNQPKYYSYAPYRRGEA